MPVISLAAAEALIARVGAQNNQQSAQESLFPYDSSTGSNFLARGVFGATARITRVKPPASARKVSWNGFDAHAILCDKILKHGGSYFLPAIIYDNPPPPFPITPATDFVSFDVLRTDDDGITWTRPAPGPALDFLQEFALVAPGVAISDTQVWVIHGMQGFGFAPDLRMQMYDITNPSTWQDLTADFNSQTVNALKFLDLHGGGSPLAFYTTAGDIGQWGVTTWAYTPGTAGMGSVAPGFFGSPGSIGPPNSNDGPYVGASDVQANAFGPPNPYVAQIAGLVTDPNGSQHCFYSGPPSGVAYRRFPGQQSLAGTIATFTQTDVSGLGWGLYLDATAEGLFAYIDTSDNMQMLRLDLSNATVTNNANPLWIPTATTQFIDSPPANGNGYNSTIRPITRISPDGTRIRVYMVVNSPVPLNTTPPFPASNQGNIVYWEQIIGSTSWSSATTIGTWRRDEQANYGGNYPKDADGTWFAIGQFPDGTIRGTFACDQIWFWLGFSVASNAAYICGKGNFALG